MDHATTDIPDEKGILSPEWDQGEAILLLAAENPSSGIQQTTIGSHPGSR